MSSEMAHTVHPLPVAPRRADARRNRAKILDAARATFAEDGLDAQMPDIARRAGVGVGTLYRHHPTKDALVSALAQDHFAELAELAEGLCGGEDAWGALTELIWISARRFSDDRGLAEIAAKQPQAIQQAAEEQDRLVGHVARLVEHAKTQGTIRQDATVDDVGTIMCGLGAVCRMQDLGKPVSWERYVTLMLGGLRAQ
jgi:AcrR family transcriptional regulator